MTCEVVEIIASSADKPSIDADLKDLQKKLKKGPFAAFNKFVKSARISKTLTVRDAETFDTPKGKTDLIIQDIDRPAKKRARVSLNVDIEDEAGKRYVGTKSKIDAGDFLLFARSIDDSTAIVTAVGCR
jgi:hypothetical protein